MTNLQILSLPISRCQNIKPLFVMPLFFSNIAESSLQGSYLQKKYSTFVFFLSVQNNKDINIYFTFF